MARRLDPKIAEFMNKYGVDTRGACWIWLRGVDSYGYPQPRIGGRSMLAHRYIYTLATGDDIDGLVVMHTCDNRRCLNPAHLRLGTQAENIRDRHIKGRDGACRGEDAPWSKIDEALVQEIRDRRADGWTLDRLTAHYPISKTQIARITKGESWSHIQ